MHEFVPGKINEQLDKEAVEATAAKEEQKAQATGSSQSIQALTSNTMFEGKLALIIGVL
jgi:hemin uptake protein HemP